MSSYSLDGAQRPTLLYFCGVLGGVNPSLEDVVVLTSLPLFDGAHAIGVTLEGEDQKRVNFLNKAFSDSRYAANKATYLSWEISSKSTREGKLSTGYRLFWLTTCPILFFQLVLRMGSIVMFCHSPFC